MQGFGGMVTFDVDGTLPTALALYDRLRVFQRAASLGGVESLCSLPVLTSQVGASDDDLARAGVTRGMLRLSVGLEDRTTSSRIWSRPSRSEGRTNRGATGHNPGPAP